jgi:siroheme synthase-like protein
VVGGGPVAARRTEALLAAGAAVTVVAPELDPALESLAESGSIEVRHRPFRTEDVDGGGSLVLVVTATGDDQVDRLVGERAAARGILVNRADDGPAGDLSFPAVVRRGPVSVAVGSGGRAPAVSRWLARLLDDRLDELIGLGPEGYGQLVELVEEVRVELRDRGSSGAGEGTGVTPGPLNWRAALDGSILGLIDQGRRAEAKERLLACLSSS